MYAQILDIVFLQKSTGGLTESQLAHKLIIIDHLLGELARRTGEKCAQSRRQGRQFLPAKRGDQVIKIDLREGVELGCHLISVWVSLAKAQILRQRLRVGFCKVNNYSGSIEKC